MSPRRLARGLWEPARVRWGDRARVRDRMKSAIQSGSRPELLDYLIRLLVVGDKRTIDVQTRPSSAASATRFAGLAETAQDGAF